MRLFVSFRAHSAPLRVKTTFMPSGDEALHFRPLRGPPVEMTEAQILITIGISIHYLPSAEAAQNEAFG